MSGKKVKDADQLLNTPHHYAQPTSAEVVYD